MLTARASKRDKANFFSNDLRWDILDGETPIGGVVYDRGPLNAALIVNGESFTAARVSDRPDERLYQALVRVLAGGVKPPPNPFALQDAAGGTLALAESAGKSFAVSRGEESFTFRKGASRPFNLYREGDDKPLGWVGQEKFWTTKMHMSLPAEFDAPFQIFLLVLLLNLTMQRLERMGDLSG